MFVSSSTQTQVQGQTSVSKLLLKPCHYCGKRNILNQFHLHNQCKFNPSVNQNIAKINRETTGTTHTPCKLLVSTSILNYIHSIPFLFDSGSQLSVLPFQFCQPKQLILNGKDTLI